MTFARFRKKLTHPFLLVAQGFAVGSLLFWVTMPADVEASVPVAAPAAAIAP